MLFSQISALEAKNMIGPALEWKSPNTFSLNALYLIPTSENFSLRIEPGISSSNQFCKIGIQISLGPERKVYGCVLGVFSPDQIAINTGIGIMCNTHYGLECSLVAPMVTNLNQDASYSISSEVYYLF